MKLYFMLARRVPPVLSPVLREVFMLLEARGFQIEGGIAEELVTRPDRLECVTTSTSSSLIPSLR